MSRFECVIGLEVHIQLATESKLFSGASARFGAAPNEHACLIDAALPGVLPVCNAAAVRMAVTFGLAIGAQINRRSIFARKNYFYPDLPKGYQISQYEIPVVGRGSLNTEVDGKTVPVGITRAHIEEDAGKSLHTNFAQASGIDLNRAGTPLLEIVSEPDIRSAAQAADYMRRLHRLVTYLGICDGNMQEGSMRCDANVSMRPVGTTELGTRTELKNINSFRFVERGIVCECERQIEMLESGGTIVQETRLYDPAKNITRPMRGKEDAHDYRYFPDPDLPPLVLDDELIESIRGALPELPEAKQRRFMDEYGLTAQDAERLTQSRPIADYFENAISDRIDANKVANWVSGELFSYLNKHGLGIEHSKVSARQLGQLVAQVEQGAVSGRNAKVVFEMLWDNPQLEVDAVIASKGLGQSIDAGEIGQLIDDVIALHPQQACQLQDGQHKLLGFFVGQVMKASNGQANPKSVSEMLKQKLGLST